MWHGRAYERRKVCTRRPTSTLTHYTPQDHGRQGSCLFCAALPPHPTCQALYCRTAQTPCAAKRPCVLPRAAKREACRPPMLPNAPLAPAVAKNCPAGYASDGVQCYPACRQGYSLVTGICYQDCPAGAHVCPYRCREGPWCIYMIAARSTMCVGTAVGPYGHTAAPRRYAQEPRTGTGQGGRQPAPSGVQLRGPRCLWSSQMSENFGTAQQVPTSTDAVTGRAPDAQGCFKNNKNVCRDDGRSVLTPPCPFPQAPASPCFLTRVTCALRVHPGPANLALCRPVVTVCHSTALRFPASQRSMPLHSLGRPGPRTTRAHHVHVPAGRLPRRWRLCASAIAPWDMPCYCRTAISDNTCPPRTRACLQATVMMAPSAQSPTTPIGATPGGTR